MLGQHHETPAVGQAGELVHRGPLNGGKLPLHHQGQVHQHLHVFVAEGAGLGVDDAQRAQLAPAGAAQGAARIEPHMRWAGDHGVVAKALVLQRIRDDKGAIAQDGVAAKRDIARRLAQLHARAGFEPLAVFVHQAHQRNVHPEQAPGHAREAVKPLLGDGVQHIE